MGSGSGPIGFGGRLDGRVHADAATFARAATPAHAPARARRGGDHARLGRADRRLVGPPAVLRHGPGARIHYGAGYSGHGAGPTWLGGQILSRLALGIDDELTRLPLVTRRSRSCRPSRSAGSAAGSCALRSWPARRPKRGAPRAAPARVGAALPRLLGLRIGTRYPRPSSEGSPAGEDPDSGVPTYASQVSPAAGFDLRLNGLYRSLLAATLAAIAFLTAGPHAPRSDRRRDQPRGRRHRPIPAALAWKTVAGCDHYQFQISANPGMNSPVLGAARTTSPPATRARPSRGGSRTGLALARPGRRRDGSIPGRRRHARSPSSGR